MVLAIVVCPGARPVISYNEVMDVGVCGYKPEALSRHLWLLMKIFVVVLLFVAVKGLWICGGMLNFRDFFMQGSLQCGSLVAFCRFGRHCLLPRDGRGWSVASLSACGVHGRSRGASIFGRVFLMKSPR